MKKRNRFATLAATALVALGLLVSGCGGTTNESTAKGTVTVTVGATPVPHEEILKEIKPLLEKEGVNLKIVEFTDYVKPNLSLQDKEIDANFYQHTPYLDKFNEERGTTLKAVAKVHIEPMGIYSHKIKDLKAVTDNSKIAIPNDPTNGGRSLLLLQSAGLLKLKNGGSVTSTLQDIVENPHHLKFVELDAAQVPRAIDDVTLAVINTNFAIPVGLNPLKDALFLEPKDSPYANILVVRSGDENRPEIQKLIKALQSPEVKKFIETKYKGAILPSF
ncbi:MetQ/NlpA family ABC transporter substrate-binding protein [Megasphaera sp. UPII 135-E]|uniref:MetQ/NlpA family ABC transporter substrate-binding protein n=1 Tax=Megasphaera sp. UPII 135-E TaxID=1000569 RepID=UPI00021A3A92|nr:MetQ/NlpA family ABC transporter substrate-binding protein [Megasphaera sp. UPII 135-E]EGS36898.1 lipoprotein, YaeC family [Megasphaera sp. UPII 135-E]MUP48829.1 MetQ/NlpA family ABC transporter substrate-binding protein [Veillonellaceae bacterium M2-8]MUP59800.1 MetQ/NlpA family ABC transporter substrate-binding protein [Veillonellaceae bacterium M2-4]